jgi:hydrogenase maturation protein HypF
MTQAEIILNGIVQGVGFRPFVKRTALKFGLYGFVENREYGVRIVAVGKQEKILEFYKYLLQNYPPVAKILEHTIKFEKKVTFSEKDFHIKLSQKNGEITALIPPDIATCPQCLSEIDNPNDRHYNYPFTNCTNCGPRFSIIKSLPYDRENTTMDKFTMCEDCEQEYNTVEDRRFHAQPNACPACGPQVSLFKNTNGRMREIANKEDAINKAAQLLQAGNIVAIKGLGGYHLACDATNKLSVERLRALKKRPYKPFALMANSIDTIKKYCRISPAEEKLLTGSQKPVVLLRKKSPDILSYIAPGIDTIGFMLPYTPIHHLIFRHFTILVMTSGNVAEDALEKDDTQAFSNLSTFTDYFLTYNREIFNRVDDSIVKFVDNQAIIFRKARGFIPIPIKIANVSSYPQLFAAGGDMKGSFGLLKKDLFLGSQYLGDLQVVSNNDFYQETLRYFQKVFEIEPQVVIADLHPNYFSTQFAQDFAKKRAIPFVQIQHHIAHSYSVMAEKQLTQAIGVSFDGTGFGSDGNSWGGEFFLLDGKNVTRMAHLRYVPLLSGDLAAREPWRMALAYIFDSLPEKAKGFFSHEQFPQKPALLHLLKEGNIPVQTSSIGRLFDAVASLLRVTHQNTYEGEAPMRLESLVTKMDDVKPYSWELHKRSLPWEIDIRPMIQEIIKEVSDDVDKHISAARFHRTLSDVVKKVCRLIKTEFGISTVVCSGGVFQNVTLVSLVKKTLQSHGFDVYFNEHVPPNDAGVALGQIYGYLLCNGYIKDK